jgi:hypothetical protein
VTSFCRDFSRDYFHKNIGSGQTNNPNLTLYHQPSFILKSFHRILTNDGSVCVFVCFMYSLYIYSNNTVQHTTSTIYLAPLQILQSITRARLLIDFFRINSRYLIFIGSLSVVDTISISFFRSITYHTIHTKQIISHHGSTSEYNDTECGCEWDRS